MPNSPPKQFILKEQARHARMIYNSSIWQQFPYILIYPLQGHALPIVLIFAFILWLFSWNPIFGSFGLIVFLGWSLNYAYGVLEHTILGYAIPPALSFKMIWSIINQRSLKQLFFLGLMIAIYFTVQTSAGQIPAFLVLVSFFLLIPANITVIATQNSWLNTLNPFQLFQSIFKIGNAYFFLLFIFGGLTALILYAGSSLDWINNQIIGSFSLLLIYISVLYFGLMSFHLLGFVIYHRRHTFGLEVFFSPEREAAAQQEARDKQFEQLLDEVYWLARQQGKKTEALETLFAKITELGETVALHKKLFARLRLWEQKSIALAQGQRYLSLLIQTKQLRQALTIYQACLELSPQFEPETPSQMLLLAQMAYQQKNDQVALHLLENFLSRYPNHPDKVAIEFLKIKLFAEHLKNVDKAKMLIAQLLKFESHPLLPEIKQYAKFLNKL
jgi:tetratricopeptide (TPR) repeat protein